MVISSRNLEPRSIDKSDFLWAFISVFSAEAYTASVAVGPRLHLITRVVRNNSAEVALLNRVRGHVRSFSLAVLELCGLQDLHTLANPTSFGKIALATLVADV
jgi:hypothetical protein